MNRMYIIYSLSLNTFQSYQKGMGYETLSNNLIGLSGLLMWYLILNYIIKNCPGVSKESMNDKTSICYL